MVWLFLCKTWKQTLKEDKRLQAKQFSIATLSFQRLAHSTGRYAEKGRT